MALTVEDGSIISGANSYVDRATFISYALDMGAVAPDDATTDAKLIKAAKFIDGHEESLIGRRVDRSQSMAFPRYEVIIDGFSWQHNEIPQRVIECQMALALDLVDGIDIYNPEPALAVKREKVEGAVEVEYFGTGAGAPMTHNSASDSLLNTLLTSGGSMSIPVTRA